jgi:hypothetical protein
MIVVVLFSKTVVPSRNEFDSEWWGAGTTAVEVKGNDELPAGAPFCRKNGSPWARWQDTCPATLATVCVCVLYV